MSRTKLHSQSRPGNGAFGDALRQWRATRKLSQFDLSLNAGISQRHVSFLESGRAAPSRHMVQQLAEALAVPLRERNHLLMAAGYASVFETRALDDPDMAPIMQALQLTLKHHEPNPAIVVDGCWNLLLANAAMGRLLSLMGDVDAMWTRVCPDGSRNILQLTFHPDGVRDYLSNWNEVALSMLMRIRREAETQANPKLSALVDAMLEYPGIPKQWRFHDGQQPPPPILPLEFSFANGKLRLISMIATFDRAQDVTADELRVEHFFPADQDSAAQLQALANAARNGE